MTEETKRFVAKTSVGTPIRIFPDRAAAMAWSDTEGKREFPRHTIEVEIEVRGLGPFSPGSANNKGAA